MALTGDGLAIYAKSKLGTPYFYGSKIQYGKLTEDFMKQMHKAYPSTVTDNYMAKARKQKQVGKVNCDCSGLIYGYRGKNVGSAQLYSTAKKRLPISEWKNFANGTVVWHEGHVGVYIGNGYVIEEKGIDYGCVKTKITDGKWKYGLTFSDMTYSYATKVSGTTKAKNPYKKPTSVLKNGASGDGVKWVQFELIEAGYTLKIDGIFGDKTEEAVRKFQKSCKIGVDGVVGTKTISKLVEN